MGVGEVPATHPCHAQALLWDHLFILWFTHTHAHTRMGMCRHVSLPSFLFMSVGASDKRRRWTNRVTLLQCTYAAARPPPSAMYISWIRMKNSVRNNSVPPLHPSIPPPRLSLRSDNPAPPSCLHLRRPPTTAPFPPPRGTLVFSQLGGSA